MTLIDVPGLGLSSGSQCEESVAFCMLMLLCFLPKSVIILGHIFICFDGYILPKFSVWKDRKPRHSEKING